MRYLYFISIILVFICILVAIISARSQILYFVHHISAILVLLPSAFLVLASYSFGEIGQAFTSAFKKRDSTPTELKNGLLFFKSLQTYLILSAVIATLIGFMSMLVDLKDKNLLASGIAVSLLSILYSLVLMMIITVPFRTGITKKLNELEGGGK